MKTKKQQNPIVARAIGLYWLLLFIFIIIIFRVIYIQWFEFETWKAEEEKRNFRQTKIEPNRGDIYARDGRILASSVPEYELRLDMGSDAFDKLELRKKADSLSFLLSNLFGDRTAEQYKRDLKAAAYRGEHYYLVKKNVTYQQMRKALNFPLFRLGQYKGGLIVKMKYKRVKPFGEMAARTIGYLQNNGKATVGIEGYYDSILSGIEGRRLEQRIAGNYWKPVDDKLDIEPKEGNDIVSTIDINIQDVAHNALLNTLIEHKARHGTAILMEVKTGEILAISNLMRVKPDVYRESYNFAVGESTEPGSTIKLASIMIALEDGYVDLDDKFDTGKGTADFYGFTIRDSKKEGFGKITVQEMFELSSNVGIAKMVNKFYDKREKHFVERLYQMHFNQPAGIDILGEAIPYIKYPGDKLWSKISLLQMAYGYELQLTPLQILSFYNAVANNGIMVKPKLVKAISSHGEIIKEFDTEIIDNKIASASVIRKAQQMLEGVVENGTAKNLSRNAYKIAGKTGTAQIANEKYGYEYNSKVSYLASFVGYFPAKDPRYSCIVVVNEPANSQYYGNAVAGPVFKEIADKVYATRPDMVPPLQIKTASEQECIPTTLSGSKSDLKTLAAALNIPIDDQSGSNSKWIVSNRTDNKVKIQTRSASIKQVPNVLGMGIRDAIVLCENAGLKVEISGRGIVTRQSLQPFEPARDGAKIILSLSNNF